MVKFGARLIRGVFYGVVLGNIMFLIAYFLGSAINGIAGSTVINQTALGVGMFGIGFTAPIVIEISKDLENQK